jgi:hypothetical protein
MPAKPKLEDLPEQQPTSTAMTAAIQQQPPAPLPPEHVDHAAVFYNEIAMRKQGFEIGLAAIDAEIEGKKIEREEKIAEIERNFASDMASLDKRRTMMIVGIAMSNAGMAAWPSPEGQQNPEQQHQDADGDDNQQQR